MHEQEFPLETIAIKTLFENDWLRLDEETVRDRNGGIRPYVLSSSKEYVIVVPVNAHGEVLLLRQYKHGARRYVRTFPAGYGQKGETPEDAARRELAEETGYVARAISHVCSLTENHTTSRGQFHVFVAERCDRDPNHAGNPDADEGESDETWVSMEALLTVPILSQIASASVAAAIPWLFAHFASGSDTVGAHPIR